MTTALAITAPESAGESPRCETALVRVSSTGADAAVEREIRCRRKRRLGQHVVADADGRLLGLDTYLAQERVQGTNQRYIVTAASDVEEDLLRCIAMHAESGVVIRTRDCRPTSSSGSAWMIDADQVAALVGHGWRPREGQDINVSCGRWTSKAHHLQPPNSDGTALKGRALRDELESLIRYGAVHGTNPELSPTNSWHVHLSARVVATPVSRLLSYSW